MYKRPLLSCSLGSGNIITSKDYAIHQIFSSGLPDSFENGEEIKLQGKEMGLCEFIPDFIDFSKNGRFFAVAGNTEFIIYTSKSMKTTAFGRAIKFVWGYGSNFVILEDQITVKIFENFKMNKVFKIDYIAQTIFLGEYLNVKTENSLYFYDLKTLENAQTIEVKVIEVFWSQNNKFCISTETECYFFDCNTDCDKDAFTSIAEIQEKVISGLWHGNIFIYCNNKGDINCVLDGEILELFKSFDVFYKVGILKSQLVLTNGRGRFVFYKFPEVIFKYLQDIITDQTEPEEALEEVPDILKNRIATFLIKKGFEYSAFRLTKDLQLKFSLALKLKLIKEAEVLAGRIDRYEIWRQLGNVAINYDIELAKTCFIRAKDYPSVLLIASTGENINNIGCNSINFLINFAHGNTEDCLNDLLKCKKYYEALYFASTYLPEKITQITEILHE